MKYHGRRWFYAGLAMLLGAIPLSLLLFRFGGFRWLSFYLGTLLLVLGGVCMAYGLKA